MHYWNAFQKTFPKKEGFFINECFIEGMKAF